MPKIVGHNECRAGGDGKFENHRVARIYKIITPKVVYVVEVRGQRDLLQQGIHVGGRQWHLVWVAKKHLAILQHQGQRNVHLEDIVKQQIDNYSRRTEIGSQAGYQDIGVQDDLRSGKMRGHLGSLSCSALGRSFRLANPKTSRK